MLEDCLFSVNKRAKNWRDKAHEYKQKLKNSYYLYDRYNYVDRAHEKKDEYYHKKDILLSVLDPVCIHKEKSRNNRIRIYDYQPEYKNIKEEDVVWKNCYYDYEDDIEVYFKDIENPVPSYIYYLYYVTPNRSFHTPINEDSEEFFVSSKKLETIEIFDLETHGMDVGNLLSVQFCDKVINVIQNGSYQLIEEVG